jgi:hypothetical protein
VRQLARLLPIGPANASAHQHFLDFFCDDMTCLGTIATLVATELHPLTAQALPWLAPLK